MSIRSCAVMLIAWLGLCAAAHAGPRDLVFTATGDGPRAEEDWMVLQKQIDADNAEGKTAFLLHLGDIWKGSDQLPESHYLQVAALLRTSVAPVYIVPGDNEWNDLKDPAEGWTFWTNHLLKLDEHWKKRVRVDRQPGREENLAWVQDKVLFIGVNVVGGTIHDPLEWKTRHAACAEWVKSNLAEHARVRAAVVFAQARPKEHHEDFFLPFVDAARGFGRPVMYLHGDGHKYEVEQGWREPNITRVQVDQVSKARPLMITATPDPKNPFLFDRRLAK